jgi:predicted transcriptional regulator
MRLLRRTHPEFAGRTNTEEVSLMTDYNAAQAGGTAMRTLAVRITDDLRAQLDIIAQLNDRSVTEEIRFALEHWIERSKSDPQVLKRAAAVRADIERDAQVKNNAIDAIFRPESGKSKASSPSRPIAPEMATSS